MFALKAARTPNASTWIPTVVKARPAGRPRTPEPGTRSVPPSRLTVGRANDPLEREADRVADELMRGLKPRLSAGPAQLSRKCADCAEEDEKEGMVQAKQASPAPASVAPGLVHDVLASPGQALDASTRSFMESRFDADFAHVRVHADARSAASARALRAQAYTVGQHIVFDAGRFAPGDHVGQRLLAHELAHVVQQSAAHGRTPALQRQPDDDAVDVESENVPAQSGGETTKKRPDAPGCDNLQWLPRVGVASPDGFLAVMGTYIASDGTLYMPSFNRLSVGSARGPEQQNFYIDIPSRLFGGRSRYEIAPGSPITVTSSQTDAALCDQITATGVTDGRVYSLKVCLCPVGVS